MSLSPDHILLGANAAAVALSAITKVRGIDWVES
jgi:hypothetical protein